MLLCDAATVIELFCLPVNSKILSSSVKSLDNFILFGKCGCFLFYLLWVLLTFFPSHVFFLCPRILKEHEDKVKEKTIELQSDTNKKSCCMRQ